MIIHSEYAGDKLKIVHAQDHRDIIQSNKELSKSDGWDKERGLRHLARIPITAYYSMIKKYPEIQVGDWRSKQRALIKALADPEFNIWKLRHE